MLKLYNTLTRKIEEFKPQNHPEVTFYSCGPTVYDYAHIGHARTYIFNDVLQKTLKYAGYKVKRVMNITDVGHLTSDADTGEDKMEKGARREKKSVWEIAKYYTDDFFDMVHKLNIEDPQVTCRATDHIQEMIDLVKRLEGKGFTYKTEDGIYFDTEKLPDYGKLTGQTFSELKKTLKAGTRIEIVKGKKNITDFALWKFSKEEKKRQMEWNSPWGRGFPGWHIECSAMSMKYLGDTIDIHTGGVDHIRIHHTNEIAQSEGATGKQFVRYWLHAEHLLVDGEKMSKSKNNFLRVKDLEEKGFDPLSLRYLFLSAHYRTSMNFTIKSLKGAEKALFRLGEQVISIKREVDKKSRTSMSNDKLKKLEKIKSEFNLSVFDDLNTSKALSFLWSLVKSNISPIDKYEQVLEFDKILGLGLCDLEFERKKIKTPQDILKLVRIREKLRKKKKWQEADKIREKIKDKGYEIEDTLKGPKVEIKQEI